MAEVLDDYQKLIEYVQGMKIDNETMGAIELAIMAGWKIIVTSQWSITLVPYDEVPGKRGKRIHISLRKPVPVRKMMGQIQRWGDPVRMALMTEAAHESVDDPERKRWNELTEVFFQDSRVEFKVPENNPKRPRQSKPPVEEKAEQKVAAERRLISERPALMHYSLTQEGGRSYLSKTTIERRWSDGTVDYACAVPTCDSTSDNRRSFAGAHWAMHVRKGEAEPYDPDEAKASVVDDPGYTQPAWSRRADVRSRRSQSLAAMLQGINLKVISAEDLAEQIMEFLGDNGGGSGGPNSKPLTDTEVLDRIRTLCDRGTYAEQEKAILDRDRQIEDLTKYSDERVERLEQAALEADQRATKAESHLNALRDLINENVGGGQ